MLHLAKRSVALILVLLLVLPMGVLPAIADELTQLTNLPTLYITLDNGVGINQIQKGTQLPGTFSLRAEGFENMDNMPITIKGRGNSTWQLPKKPYQIKFGEKVDLLGMGKAKKWILLANYWDKTLMRNAITYQLANDTNNIFSVEYRFVDVYMNGEYRGNYLLTEKVELGKARINEDAENGAALFELEQQYRHAADGCDACIITDSGVHVTMKEPEEDEDFSADRIEEIKAASLAKLNAVERAIPLGYDHYSKLIDVQSFLDWYIQNELAKNYDAAFVTSSYCYLDESGLLHMGPVWDVDVCFGNQDVTYPESTDNGLNYYNYRADKGAWYMALFQDETFVTMLKERWAKLKEQGHITGMITQIDRLAETLARSQALENQVWPDAMMVTTVRDQGKGNGGTVYYDFESEVDYLKDWLTRRINWLDSQWNDDYWNESNYTKVASVTGEEIYNPRNSTVSNGIWSWEFRGINTTNRKISSSEPFFSNQIERGQYTVSASFKPGTTNRTTDYLMLRLVGVNRYNGEYTLLSTPATQVTYAMAPKDADGYAKLNLTFNTDEYSDFTSFYVVVDAYHANASLRDVALYQTGEQRPLNAKGDVDGNGVINATDALQVLRFSVGKTELSASQQYAAEVDGKTGINAGDALQILRYAVDLIDHFPVEEPVD